MTKGRSFCIVRLACVLVILSSCVFTAGCAERAEEGEHSVEQTDSSPYPVQTDEMEKDEKDGKILYDNPIDEYFLPKINAVDASQAEIRAYQDDYKYVWKEEFENLTKWLRKKCIFEEDKKKIQEMKKSVSEYVEQSKEVILTELLDTYKVNPNPERGEESRNSYWGNGTRSRLNQIEGEIYRDASMRIINLYGAGEKYEFRKVEYSVSGEGKEINMKKFDEQYKLLEDMYEDSYFPDFLVDKVKGLVQEVIVFLENGERDLEKIQKKFDAMTEAVNELQEEFEENDSELETAARDSIGETVAYILNWFDIDIDVEEAIRMRDW